jgi:cytochrome oxidase Cu insertion factor (SCO1/SenC/PrrC family)
VKLLSPLLPYTPYNLVDRSTVSPRRVPMGFQRAKDKVTVGSVAPDFTLPSQAGEMVSLKDFLGRKSVVMVFQQYKEQIP